MMKNFMNFVMHAPDLLQHHVDVLKDMFAIEEQYHYFKYNSSFKKEIMIEISSEKSVEN